MCSVSLHQRYTIAFTKLGKAESPAVSSLSRREKLPSLASCKVYYSWTEQGICASCWPSSAR